LNHYNKKKEVGSNMLMLKEKKKVTWQLKEQDERDRQEVW
jgi:hypothetical protein